MRNWVALALAATAACTTGDEPVTAERMHDACAPLSLVSATPSDVQLAGMSGAEDLWRDFGAPALGRRAGTTMDVRFEDAAAAFHGLYDDVEGVIYINRGIESEQVLSIVIAHELGHAFGLPHITDRPSVMNPGNVTITPNADDRGELQALWGECQ